MSEPAEKVKVFISSVQNKEIEDLDSERSEVIKTVKDYPPTTPWAFEHTPASDLSAEDYYLRGVRGCHLFILLLGEQVTDAVRKEYNEAVRLKKPIFAFLKDVQRSNEAEKLLNLVQKQSLPCLSDEEVVKIAEFAKSVELHYGIPQDIEWSVDADQPFPENIFLVQTRLVTIVAEKKSPTDKIFDLMLAYFRR